MTAKLLHQKFLLSTRRADKVHIEQRIFFCKCEQSTVELSKRLSSKFCFQRQIIARGYKYRMGFQPASRASFCWQLGVINKTFQIVSNKFIGLQTRHDNALNTFVCEIKFSMSSRLLSNVPADITDPLPLSRNHFFLGRPSNNVPPCIFLNMSVTLSKSWKNVQPLVQQFWNCFVREHLPERQARTKWNTTSNNLSNVDLVWLLEDYAPRDLWPLAKVLEHHPASHGTVRSVTLQTPHGKIVRPVIKLSRLFPKEWLSLASFIFLYAPQFLIFVNQFLQKLYRSSHFFDCFIQVLLFNRFSSFV